jgi:hypothetical protein
MHSTAGPAGKIRERIESEPIGSFRLAGVDGGFKGLVTIQDIILERSDGRGIRIAIDAISKVRHHLTPTIPRGFAVLSLLGLFGSFRIFVDPLRGFVIAASSLVLVLWMLGRRPVLVIDTDGGDRHRLTADERSLLKTRLLISRIRDGMNLEEAVDGLNELLEDTRFPTIRPIEEEAAALAAGLLDDADASDLESALDRLRNGDEETVGTLSNRSVNPDSSAVFDAEIVESRGGLFGDTNRTRSTRALTEQRSAHTAQRENEAVVQHQLPEQTGYETTSESPFGFGSGSEDFFGASMFDDNPAQTTGQTQQSDSDGAFGGGGDLFGFGEAAFTNETDQTGQQSSNNPTKVGQLNDWNQPTETAVTQDGWNQNNIAGNRMLPVQSTGTRQPSSMELIRRAQEVNAGSVEGNLPPPSTLAIREECMPGLVQSARIGAPASHQPIENIPPEAVIPTTETGHPLSNYPSLAGVVDRMPRTRRVQVRQVSALSALAKGFAKGIHNMTSRNQSEIDDYSIEYGDETGSPGRSTQFLWLRADQDHQASIAAGASNIGSNRGGTTPKDALSQMVRCVAAENESKPLALPAPVNGPATFDAMQRTRTGDDSEGVIPGIRRFG